eukprot:Hpha_TRINITY_DN12879_c0_g2::TRINITY_DN12879_c0_g2_i1::g.23963::m.23963
MAARHILCFAALLLFSHLAAARTLGDCTGGNPNGTVGDNSADLGGITLDLGECSWTDYAKSKWYAVLPAVIGVLLFIIGPIFVCCRGCCCKCDDEVNATPGRVMCVRLLIVFFLLAAAAGCAMVLLGSHRGHDSYKSMFEGLQEVPDYILVSTRGLEQCMQGVQGFDPSDLDEVIRQANNFKDAVDDAKNTADKFEHPRTIAMPIFVGCALLLVFLFGAYSFCCSSAGKGCPCAAFLSSSFFFVAAFILLVSGLGFAVWVMGRDTCPELEKQVAGEQNLFSGLPAQACNETGLTSATDQLDSIIYQTTENACDLIWGGEPVRCDSNLLSPDPPFYCAAPQACSTTPPSLKEMGVLFNDPAAVRLKPLVPGGCGNWSNDNCTVVRCGESCGNSDLQQLASGAVQLQEAGGQTEGCSDVWVEGRELDNCTYLFNEIAISPQVDTCNTLEDAFGLLSGGTLLLGTALVGAAILAGCPLKKSAYKDIGSSSPVYGYVAPSAYGTAAASPAPSPAAGSKYVVE